MATTYKAAVVPSAGAKFDVVERDVPKPAGDQVLVKVTACGLCHSDKFVPAGAMGVQFPRAPGHEVVGVVEAVGERVERYKPGMRVGVGWFGGCCRKETCAGCRVGDRMVCSAHLTTGISFDGGYGARVVCSETALALVPDGVSDVDAAPLLCAGVTMFNALRNAGARPGDRVAIQGVGGLGHLGIQYAAKMGFETVAVSSNDKKKELAKKLGAHHYVSAADGDVGEQLTKLGGCRLVLATSPSPASMSPLIKGLGVNGRVIVIGAGAEAVSVGAFDVIPKRAGVVGWPSGTAADSEDCLRFSALFDVKPMVEQFAFADVQKAYDHMLSGAARFRVVLTHDG